MLGQELMVIWVNVLAEKMGSRAAWWDILEIDSTDVVILWKLKVKERGS